MCIRDRWCFALNDFLDEDPDEVIDEMYTKVRGHCNLNVRTYRGATHRTYNIFLNLRQNIPVFCHNMNSYEIHLYSKDLAKNYRKIDIIANTDEKYMIIQVRNIQCTTRSLQV